MRPLEFWFEFASTYSYLSAMRIEAVCAEAGVPLIWRPFLLGPIFKDQGLATSPFVLNPTKGAYMWRDVERCAAKYGLSFRKPESFPQNGLLAARVAIAAENETWLPDFVRSIFAREFCDGQDISDRKEIEVALAGLGLDATHWIAAASEESIKNKLRARTQAAASLGIFGAPTFVVGKELFWGNDRLEDACAFAKT